VRRNAATAIRISSSGEGTDPVGASASSTTTHASAATSVHSSASRAENTASGAEPIRLPSASTIPTGCANSSVTGHRLATATIPPR
jgi:hypothetical protein